MFVTHDQHEALGLSDRIAVMNAGRIEQLGAPREVYERPATRFVADFIGASTALEGRGDRRHTVALAGGQRVEVALAARADAGRGCSSPRASGSVVVSETGAARGLSRR